VGAFLANLVSFQVCWFAFVWGGASGRWWLGFIPLAVFMAWQLKASRWPKADLGLMGVALLLGIVIETGMAASGLFAYASPVPSASLAPLWMLGMWINFGLTINHSMAWFKPRLVVGALFGLLGGPLAYWLAGRMWGALTIADPQWPALLALGVGWAVAMPLLCSLAVRWVRREEAAAA
jgi:hypothetical protein